MQKCFLEIRPNSDFPISENLKMGASGTFQAQDSNVSYWPTFSGNSAQ